MKTIGAFSRPAIAGLLLAATSAWGVEFTTNTTISPLDTGYDGKDIIVSNCTVTIDGMHSFNSVLVASGGVLTHSSLPGSSTNLLFNVTNEPQILDASFPVTLLHSNVVGLVTVTDTSGLVTYSNGVDYVQTSLADGTTQIYATTNSSIPGYATVFVSYTWAYTYNAGLYLDVSNNVTVAAGGSINVNQAGYGSGKGVGHGYISMGPIYPTDGSGAGHGGSGGLAYSGYFTGGICYDSLYQPTNAGSGGGASYAGPGGSGGGYIRIKAGGSVNIDGLISANGADATNSRAGGGAGGGIWITATNVSGTGSILANGGAGEPTQGGGGGGGRISIQSVYNTFSGVMTAYGGNGFVIGGAGTLFTQTNGLASHLLVDNGGQVGAISTLNLGTSADVVISGGATVQTGSSFTPNNLTIATNSTLQGSSQILLNLVAGGNVTIQAGGQLTLDSLGYAPGQGPAPGRPYPYLNGTAFIPDGGGGHGGYGATGSDTNATGGSTYGSQTAPATFGSGGGSYGTGGLGTSLGGAGGGAVHLTVAGTLQVDGRISANGGDALSTGGGGGAGGSINVNCGTLTGSGSIVANGGSGGGTTGGGGGGGRIAVAADGSSFSGTINACGGGGANFGGAGTVFTQMAGASQLLLDNGGNLGTYTPVQTISGAALNIRNGAQVMATSAVAFNSLLVASNGWLTQLPASSLDLSISNSAVIQSGGGFNADFLGKSGGQGIAAGRSGVPPYFNCSGGGYGGKGGFAASNAAAGGVNTADTAASPSPPYSGSGGGTYYTSSLGGSGGGFCKLTVGGTLQLDGLISANGGDGAGPGGGGGGAGGGVYLTVGTLTGGGTIRVNGGTGANGGGGGGGGGRIAIYLDTNQFSGVLTAFGGGGANYGGGGTLYLKTNSFNSAQLIVDNGGNLGADTLYQSSSGTDLILRNGGNCFVSGAVKFGNLTVGSNSWLFVSNGAPSTATLYATSITVQPGGGISADSAGYNANSGNGAGTANGAIPPYFACSGAGHGGYGAGGFSNTVYGGGFYYDTASNPSLAGSGGGNNLPYSPGGKGGGVINLSLQGAIQLNGTLSANGGNGTGIGGGGGAGGSLNISCTKFTGNGVISANGGYGAPSGGGGAGGMIAISTISNLFTGTVSAYGGGGANWGGAGTLFFKTNTTGQSVLVLDNGGHRGTNTPMVLASNFILRNGASGFQSYPPQTISSLLITSNAWLVPGNNSSGMVNLTVNGNATIQSGGGIVTDASGNAQNVGTGHGNYYPLTTWNLCSGAGHGGYGGAAYTNSVSGGATYDSSAAPIISGSGGGGQAPYSTGGAGGGLVTLTVNGILQLDGSISANGGNGSGFGGGGGSGGGIRLTQTTLRGAGSITANGGFGANMFGGGGGGGRIAIFGGRIAILNTSRTNTFSGNITAYGGGGANYGGAGTIYFGSYYTNLPLLTLDNASHAGTNTTFDFTSTDATIQNGAVGVLPITGSWTPHNLLVHSNAMLIAPASSTVRTINANNVTIDAGGVISLDGAGYAAQAGPGAGLLSPGTPCGGGHGGYGGAYGSSSSSRGGNANDSILSPVMAGSGGGNYNSITQLGLTSTGGTGGGALQLTASTLTVNGRLSANGTSGGYHAGGGAGGSLYLASINTLTGNGIIAANGGGNTGWAGGGGGGRIALNCVNNTFSGQLSTVGGNGVYPGGAGTIYTSVAGVNTLLANNGGIISSNGLVAGTPLGSDFSMPSFPFNLTISGAATVLPVSPLPLINNLNLAAGASIASPGSLSNLFISVLHNADLGGTVTADAFGYAQGNGPGAGGSVTNQGAGGGYGGAGGNSANGATGGMTYGSAAQPVDFGSGGGAGTTFLSGGSAGGGAIHLSVGGALNLTGSVTANGDAGQQDNSGGGAGGSAWINAGTFSGTGRLSAAGGGGNLYNGGGGGGGRIAIHAPTNLFAGTTNVNGGDGANPGQAGTVFLSSVLNGLQIISQTPTGKVFSTVSSVSLSFNEAIDPASLSAAAFSLNTPTGLVSAASMSVAPTSAATVQVSFPVQSLLGDYSITAATTLTNIFGQSLAAPYTGAFTIAPLTVAGTVTDTNGTPAANVLVQPDGGLTGAMTDTNGDYSIMVPPGWTGSLSPSLGSSMFVPGTLSYTNLAGSLSGQNFLIVPTIAPGLTTSVSGTSLVINWNGLAGVTYQTWWSTNLVDWSVLGDPVPGTNGPMQIILPLSTDPADFFRIGASN